jgi:hypothetical protein
MYQGKAWTSYIVRALTNSRWTHCGILWRDPPNLPSGLYVIHSDGTLDDFGVQMDLFSQYVEEYPGKVFIYPICGVEPANFAPLEAIFKQTQDAGYDLYPPDIIRTLNGGGCLWRARTTQYFVCSTYIAYVYEQLGLICPCNDWTLVRPKDLLESPDKVHWQNCTFGDQVQIK